MRLAGLATALLLFQLPSPVGATPNGDPAGDPVGDVELAGDTQYSNPPQAEFAHIDITKTDVSGENKSGIWFWVHLNKMEEPAQGAHLRRSLGWFFQRDDNGFRIAVPGSCPGASLDLYNSTAKTYRTVRCLERKQIAAENAIGVFAPRALLVNALGVPLRGGDELRSIFVQSRANIGPALSQGTGSTTVGNKGIYATDRAPNNDFLAPFRSTFGNESGFGSLHLTSPAPIRVSNGESTTLAYKVLLTNDRENPENPIVTIENEEDSFTVRAPARVKAPGKSTVEFPVILSMNFTHRHGVTSFFKVVATSTGPDASRGVVNLGVYWTETAQPAGHHDVLKFHSAPSSDQNPTSSALGRLYEARRTWMNPVDRDPDPAADDGNVPAYEASPTGGGSIQVSSSEVRWRFPLAPRLLIGLDFDLERETTLRATILPALSSSYALLHAQLDYCNPNVRPKAIPGALSATDPDCGGTWQTIAKGNSTPGPLQGGTKKHFEFPLTLNASFDLVPYVAGSNLRLDFTLASAGHQNPGTPTPRPEFVTKEGELRLPLIEYHDPIDESFQSVGLLQLEPVGPREKGVNPGEVTVFTFALTNHAPDDHAVFVTLEGHNSDWALVASGERGTLAPHERFEIVVAVTAPSDANPDERAELFVVVESLSSSNTIAISRLRATVVAPESHDIVDEAPKLNTVKKIGSETPSVGAMMVVCAIGSALLGWRLRRN